MPDAPPQAQLRRTLRFSDLVLFNIVAVLGLRWLATSAKSGPSAITLWCLAALLFFIPEGLAIVELSSRFPEEGGIYFWTKRTFGEGHGFLCGWCYWVNNVLYYPNLLISAAVVATYAIGRGGTALADDWTYVLAVTVVCLWLAVILNIVGVGTGKWLQNLGAIGSYVPGAILILLGIWGVATHPSANPFTARSLIPNLGDLSELNLWASIAFAFAGLELSATMGDEIEHPRRNLPRAIFISAPLIAIVYILGAGALLWFVPVGHINIVSGFLQAIAAGAHQLGGAAAWLWWLAPVAALCYTIGNIGGVGAWLAGPARVAFVIGLDRFFPPAFGRVHPRWHTPYVAIIVQAALATIFLLISELGKGTTVEHAYLILLDTQLLIYFIPYVYLFLCFLVNRRRPVSGGDVIRAPGGSVGGWSIGIAGLLVTLFAMGVAMVPAGGTSPLGFELKVVGGALAFVALGEVIYWRGRRRPDRLSAPER